MNNENIPNRMETNSNPDPITGEPGSHPIGTGIGAAGGGAAGAAIGTAVAGPVGTVIGAVVGSIAGGLGGKAAGEAIDPTTEDAYWRENHGSQPYSSRGQYDDFAPAYRTGYLGYATHSGQAGTFEDAEPRLRDDYEVNGNSSLSWADAREASRAAWLRVERDRLSAKPR